MKYPQLVSMPSAVSDWLEEQLEARGIDAVVYTRYVLSLLYRDPIDVICPDQDLHFTQPDKEVRRSGGGRKRLRRSSGWWGHDLADADRLKRSAAVECLMSASDQKCGIESLVDELCEKLKEINSNQGANCKELLPEKKRAVSPQDPAKRYYAAFPPLSKNSSVNSPNLINLIPKWFGSPKKRTPRKQNRSASYEEKLHCKIELDNMKARSVGKQRYNYFSRNKKDFGYCRNVSKSIDKTENVNNWDHLYLFNNNSNNKCSNTSWSQPKDIINFVNDTNDATENSGSWKSLDDSLNMYDDLPVDIRELLNSPSPQEDDTVEMMNLANMRDTGNKTFIPCGTNIISSIWSNDAAMDDANRIYENTFNAALDENSAESFLDLKFSSISIDNKTKWPTCDIIAENETNSYFENFGKSLLEASFSTWNVGTSEKFQKWSDAENDIDTNGIMRSLSIINHSKESSFTEVIPRPCKAGLNIFGTPNVVKLMQEAALKKLESEKEEDLLHSAQSHFKPINEKTEMRINGQYVDGTTFIIPSNVDKVSYKRSESGFLYLESEQVNSRKFLDFRRPEGGEFSLKFNVCQNDKASQTDTDPLEIQDCDKEEESFYFPGDQELLVDDNDDCECVDKTAENLGIYSDENVLNEIFGKYENKCDLCNNNSSWESEWFRTKDLDKKFDKQSIRDIWSGGEVCTSCMNMNNTHNSFSVLQSKLREDISQDGEQLLSDLSSIQKTYMEELPIAEVSCNISELIGIKERKRRHSSINYESAISVQEDCFSFATRLEEDCLMNIATIPTLRSVTL